MKIFLNLFFRNTKIEDLVVKKRNKILTNVENRINSGLERQLNCVISYAKFVLSNEQKKSDFKPEDESRDIYVMSKVSLTLSFNV